MGAVIGIWVAVTIGAGIIGANKGRTGEGIALGALLGLIGLIVIACLSPKEPQKRDTTEFNPW